MFDELVHIVDIQLAQLDKCLAQRRLQLEVSAEAKKWLADHALKGTFTFAELPLRDAVRKLIG